MLLITLILQEIYLVQQLLLKISRYSLDLKESTYILQDCKRLCKWIHAYDFMYVELPGLEESNTSVNIRKSTHYSEQHLPKILEQIHLFPP